MSRADQDLANGSMSSNQSGECDIRRALIEARKLGTLIDQSNYHGQN